MATLLMQVPVAAPVSAAVDPPVVNLVLKPGESAVVHKRVDVPAVPPKLDLCLLVDLSGSYFDDLPNIKAVAPALFDAVRVQVADSQFCLGSFVDYPFSPWGGAGSSDYAYHLNQALTASKPVWLAAVNAMVVLFGGDEPEAQYEGLYQMATGAGRDVPPAGVSFGDVAAGQNPAFRADASKVIAITTDASFHLPGAPNCGAPAPPCPFGYQGPSRNDTVNALTGAGIKVIAVKAPGSGAQMDDVAAATGGQVVTTGSTSTEIATAILAGLTAITQDITAVPVGCDPLLVSFVPPSIPDVTGPTTVEFDETIEVPADVLPGSLISCSVQFKADDTVIGIQHINVQVPLRGRMTGGGSFFPTPGGGGSSNTGNSFSGSAGASVSNSNAAGLFAPPGGSLRITHGFTLNCYSGHGGESLEVNWQGNAFHLESLDQAACFDDPAIGEEHPVAGFDTYSGRGTGRLNGTPGYTAEWRFTDAGEPGRNDHAQIVITDPDHNVVLNAGGFLQNGNHQAHPD